VAIIKVINWSYKMHTLYKPNGSEIKVNDTSLKHALSLGWTEKKPTKKKATKKAD
jgi:hypothetical protein